MKQIFLLLSVNLDTTTPISFWSELPSAYDLMKVISEPLNEEQALKLLDDLNYFNEETGVGYYLKQCFEGQKI